MFKRLFAVAKLFGWKPPAPVSEPSFLTTAEHRFVDHRLASLERMRDKAKASKKAWRPIQAQIDALKAGDQ